MTLAITSEVVLIKTVAPYATCCFLQAAYMEDILRINFYIYLMEMSDECAIDRLDENMIFTKDMVTSIFIRISWELVLVKGCEDNGYPAKTASVILVIIYSVWFAKSS